VFIIESISVESVFVSSSFFAGKVFVFVLGIFADFDDEAFVAFTELESLERFFGEVRVGFVFEVDEGDFPFVRHCFYARVDVAVDFVKNVDDVVFRHVQRNLTHIQTHYHSKILYIFYFFFIFF
jgi:hypothetical protein